jgi:tRNA(Ile)-lysidine synthase
VNEREILDRVRADGLLVAGRPVLVLLSGGRDSVCLLDLAVRIAGPDAVRALHVNYGLRETSDAEERHSVALGERLGVPVEVVRPGARPPQGNVQAWARGVRYSAAARLAQPVGADVAAGHTATDQVEGVLYRLASAPSRRALLGMRERSGIVVRPLLGLTRAQTGAYCEARGLAWCDDASNASDVYARGRIRGELVPALRAIHPGAEANVLALVQILRDEAAVLDSLVDDVLRGRREIELARLRELPASLRRLVVQRLADLAAARPAPGVAARADELAALRDRGTVSLDLGAGVRAVSEYGVLRFELATEPALVPGEVRLAIPGTVAFGSYEVHCEVGPPERRAGSLDRDSLGPELVVRAWRPGDRMAPLGLGGTKSLQDLFTARRVARSRRVTVPVVESGGEIVWVAGVATSERFKVTDATREAAHLIAVESRSASRQDTT